MKATAKIKTDIPNKKQKKQKPKTPYQLELKQIYLYHNRNIFTDMEEDREECCSSIGFFLCGIHRQTEKAKYANNTLTIQMIYIEKEIGR